ncbi:precorrin-2 C(20)-methyltransferase [Phormidesmis priestleyi ULC007]|uniref:Precorrin-2 C(20)-methyltransferase n=1 Tax=Phormidesmis priestleyi ULC007 TaxID=1920490 RepID=A0A2T1DKJ1_9CYAN|nr:precorrin-2 C(20)-methyltransferase [Phormidesmis priestleyi]PSB20992.1 precorrin-2 C(20)-methyltransferase [Phormidesmis priestleyi ULC007]PZO53672.1 MAG: precorrin-2 C(20)-methyltransferase [Phormidesmis priestleyi]
MTHETGRLYGLGIGPGDPELLTLKAYRILRSVPVIAYPTMENGKVLARAIVADFLRPEQIEVPMPLPFSPVRSSQPYYDIAAEKLAEHLSAGRDVAVLCEGEPFLYGSFMYLFNRLSSKFQTEVVPGISSTMASAAALGVPLTYRNDVLSIMPATLEADILRDRLAVADAAVIIKLGRHFSKVRDVLSELGLLSRSLYIERATMPNQRIVPIADIDAADVPYWALIMIPSLQTSVT